MSALPATANRSNVTLLDRWREGREQARRLEQRHGQAFGPGGFVPGGRPARVRNFSAADTGRLSASWLSSDVSINALLEAQLPIVRARSRTWSRNTEQGRRFLSLTRDNVAGPRGFKLQMCAGDWVPRGGKWVFQLDDLANAAIELAWMRWCRRGGGCDITGQSSFADITRIAAEVWARDGEVAARRLRGADNPFRYTLQLLAVERIDHAYRANLAGGNEVRMGVEREPSGRVVAYWCLENNPNDNGLVATRAQQRVRVPAEEMVHCFDRLEPEQLRGVPRAHAVLSGANMLHGFEESAVVAARVGASKMGFYTQTASDGGPPDPSALADATTEAGDLLMDAQPGAFDTLPPGYDFKEYNPAYPTEAFAPFVKARHRAMAAGLDVAHHNLSADLEGVNYSSARIGELSERDTWRGHQRSFIDQFLAPVFADWLEMSLLAGAIVLPNGSKLPPTKLDKFLEGATFKPRGWAWVDPLKEVNAAEKAVANGFTTRSQVVGEKGEDFEDNVIELARERDLLATHNVQLGAVAQAAAPAPAPQPPEETDE